MARVYLDSCVVIYLIQGPAELSSAITRALRPTKAERSAAAVSDFDAPGVQSLAHREG